jgi:hypothetical protein
VAVYLDLRVTSLQIIFPPDCDLGRQLITPFSIQPSARLASAAHRRNAASRIIGGNKLFFDQSLPRCINHVESGRVPNFPCPTYLVLYFVAEAMDTVQRY